MSEILEIVQEIGSYAGFAAVIGLGVLAALYFSQSRDMRALREQGIASGIAAAPPGQAAQRLQTLPPPATAAGTVSPPVPATPAIAADPGATAQATAVTPAVPPAGPRPPSEVPAAVVPSTALRATAARNPAARTLGRGPLGAERRGAASPWYAQLEPRFLALILGGVLIVGGAVIFGIASLGGDGDTSDSITSTAPNRAAGGGGAPTKPAPIDPTRFTVSVLNGTPVAGLAANTADAVVAAGFRRGNIDNTNGPPTAESQVLFTPGNGPAAQAVAKELGISQTGPVDAHVASLIGNAQIAVIVGEDQAP